MSKTVEYKKNLEILKNYNPQNNFNFAALLFGPFYLFYRGLVDQALIFLLLVFVTIKVFFAMEISGAWLNSALIMYNVIIAFYTNRWIYEKAKTYISNYENRREGIKPLYFSISVKRLIFLSLITLGIYHTYWFYKNWKAIKEYKKEYIFPFFRSWFFGLFFIYPLLKRMNKDFKNKFSVGFTASFLTVLFFLDTLCNLPEDMSVFISLPFTIFSLIFLIPLQLRINEYNKQVNRLAKPETKYYLGEVIVISFSLIMICFSLISLPFNDFEERSLERAQNSANLIHKIYISVPEVCEDHGYKMKNYQKAFLDKYGAYWNIINDNISIYDTSIEDIMADFDEAHLSMLKKQATSDLTYSDIPINEKCRMIDENPFFTNFDDYYAAEDYMKE